MIDCMTPKWIQVLEEIEKYAQTQSGANYNIIEEETETIEEEK